MEVRLGNGIHLPGCALRLDPRRKASLAVVSHAHSDHAGWHPVTIATFATIDLMKARKPLPSGCTLIELDYGEPYETEQARITLLPAGHILGSAQVLVESEEGSLLYTGDFKRSQSLTCEEASTAKVGTLVMECTFGHPRYAFPPMEQVRESILAYCRQSLSEGESPVLLAYSLGKSQELLALLAGSGMKVVVHRAVGVMSAVYEKHGVDLGRYSVWNGKNHAGKVLIIPPGSRASSQTIEKSRSVVISGWALDSGDIYRHRAQAAFPPIRSRRSWRAHRACGGNRSEEDLHHAWFHRGICQ